MKSKLILLSLVFLFSGFSAQAQIFKKIKDAVNKGVEKTLGPDEQEKDGQTADKSPNKKSKSAKGKNATANGIPGMTTEPFPAPLETNIVLPDSYRFSYRTTLRIENSKGTADPVFYLQPDAPYHARKQTNSGLTEFVVLDNQNNMVVLFGELEGKKRRMHNRMGLQTKATLVGAYKDASEQEPVKPLESKTILGYTCQGYQIATEAGITQLWITDEAPASLFSTLFEYRSDAPNSPISKNSMIMEVAFISAKAPEKNYQMVCTELEPETLVLNKTDYEAL